MPIDYELPHDPAIVDLDEDIDNIPTRPLCDYCTKPEDVMNGDLARIVAFDTHAEVIAHQRDKHPKMRGNGKEPSPVLVFQISTYISDDEESEMRFIDATDIDINSWELELKRYLNTPPIRRDVFPILGNTKNLRPIN